jgi:hypothetical protein
MADQTEPQRVFKPIAQNGITVDGSGGLVDLSYKPYRCDPVHFIGMTPEIARKVAQAMLIAADAADNRFDRIPPEHVAAQPKAAE